MMGDFFREKLKMQRKIGFVFSSVTSEKIFLVQIYQNGRLTR